MLTKTSILLAACLLGSVLASPTKTIAKRADLCGQYDSVETGAYTVYNNEWGINGATGSQCFGVDSASDSLISWHTTYVTTSSRPHWYIANLSPLSWSWSGGSDGVKTYPNAVAKYTPGTLSSLSSMQSAWSWDYTGTDNMVANVAYDLFTSSTPTGTYENEIMIWLAEYGGVKPISFNYVSRRLATFRVT